MHVQRNNGGESLGMLKTTLALHLLQGPGRVLEDPADDPPEPQNTEASAGEDVRDNLAAAVSAPDNCVPALHEHDYL
ncbi:hypothetical protein QQF64_018387 [Cirrhinus molitorella]|uniref:Uncharacterized protein n=1 Tax=Cirrhinus molitorella TaxID=172907 RepID=A0ABR3LES9_9TELE